MISKQKIYFIIIAALFLISLSLNIIKLLPETKNYEQYTEGLNSYNSNLYDKAYYHFGKVSRFSKIKSAAVYRQALCADRLGDTKTEIKKYKELIKKYPNSEIAKRAEYLKAQQDYELKHYRKAEKEFKKIINKYSASNYATGANYYLGAIYALKATNTKNNHKKEKYTMKAVSSFKVYLKTSPDGKFALNCIDKWLALKTKLNNEDYMLIVEAYQANKDYNNAKKYLHSTNFVISWPYFVKNAYETGNRAQVKQFTEDGLKNKGYSQVLINVDTDDKKEKDNIYKAIDMYLKISKAPKEAISYLLSISAESKGNDYLLYKYCNNLPDSEQGACYNSLYYKYPDGQFAAESLANIMYNKIKLQEFITAKKLGRAHLSKFKDAKSAPKVLFWLAKIAERNKNYEEARGYYKSLIRQYPDDYYAYHAYLNLNKHKYIKFVPLKQKTAEFPYKKSSYELITELVKVKDYGLLNQLYNEDQFIQSWLFYKQGDFSSSARIARDAMDNMSVKPNRFDPRWQLVYPIHYYDEIQQSARIWDNDPTLILSIIREESYFNPLAKSPVGARGLMQLMPATANEAARKSGLILPSTSLLKDPYINIKLGNVYFSNLRKLLAYKDILAVLAYNGGIGSVLRWKESLIYYDIDDFVEQIPYQETQNYLKKVYKSYWNYNRIYDGIRF